MKIALDLKIESSDHLSADYIEAIKQRTNLPLLEISNIDEYSHSLCLEDSGLSLQCLNLKAGEMSLHTDALLHGSEPNNSNRQRCGITMRFSPTNVKADLNIWPFFSTQLSRGIDTYKLNPIAPIPKGEATPSGRFQNYTDFEKEW